MGFQKFYVLIHCLNCSAGETYVNLQIQNGEIHIEHNQMLCENCESSEDIEDLEDFKSYVKELITENYKLEIEYSIEVDVLISAMISVGDLAIKSHAFFDHWDSSYGEMTSKVIDLTVESFESLLKILNDEQKLKEFLKNNNLI